MSEKGENKSDELSKLDFLDYIVNIHDKDEGYSRAYYSYPAKFLSHVPQKLIEKFTSKNDLVLDPYSGGGTTALEASLLGRKVSVYDINPLAILITNAKTTKLIPNKVKLSLSKVLKIKNEVEYNHQFMDEYDEFLLGQKISMEINNIAHVIKELDDLRYQNFFNLALIHSIKIVGRRDFNARFKQKNQTNLSKFLPSMQDLPKGASIIPIFRNKVFNMLEGNNRLPDNISENVKIHHQSNHKLDEKDGSVDLIITSPPYKDLDVEYLQIQIQRPEHKRSKRTLFINKLLEKEYVKKEVLCGLKRDHYWENIKPTLSECARVLKKKKYAFFWIGFKTTEDYKHFCKLLIDYHFTILKTQDVLLSDNRAASSRSTHHKKETHMMQRDYLIVCQRD